MDKFNEMQTVKRRFFAMRNGVIADTMRKAGSPFKIVFGLVLPQIEEIANEIGYNAELSDTLWANQTTRESMLISPMLADPTTFPEEKALSRASEIPSTEIADILVHKLLRKMPDSYNIAIKLAASEDEKQRYCALRMLWHHLQKNMEEIRTIAEAEIRRNSRLTLYPARQILDEIQSRRQGNKC